MIVELLLSVLLIGSAVAGGIWAGRRWNVWSGIGVGVAVVALWFAGARGRLGSCWNRPTARHETPAPIRASKQRWTAFCLGVSGGRTDSPPRVRPMRKWLATVEDETLSDVIFEVVWFLFGLFVIFCIFGWLGDMFFAILRDLGGLTKDDRAPAPEPPTTYQSEGVIEVPFYVCNECGEESRRQRCPTCGSTNYQGRS